VEILFCTMPRRSEFLLGTGDVRYTLNADEAIELCREVNPRTIVPLQ
jgi:hypothetical protein